MGAPQAREFSLFPPVGAPQAREFSLFPPWGLPKLGNFHFSPPWGLPKLGNFHFSFPWGLPKLEFSLFPPVGASQAREFSLFPAVTASQAMEFSLFPPLEALQVPQIPCSLNVFPCFCNGFLQSTVLYTFVAINRSKTSCSTMLPIPLSPQPLKIPLFTVFSSIFPCANAGSQLQHIYKKSFQNIVFDSVFPMFPVKQTVIYTFFAIKAVNPSKTLLLTVFL